MAETAIEGPCSSSDVKFDLATFTVLLTVMTFVAVILSAILNTFVILTMQGADFSVISLLQLEPAVFEKIDRATAPGWVSAIVEPHMKLLAFAVSAGLMTALAFAVERRPCINYRDDRFLFGQIVGMNFGIWEVLILSGGGVSWARLLSLIAHPLFAMIIADGFFRAVDDYSINWRDSGLIANRLVVAILIHAFANVGFMPWLLETFPGLLDTPL